MPLATSALKTDLKTIFDSAKDEGWDTNKIADEMSKAIAKFTKTGAVKGVKVNPDNGIQTTDGRIE